MAFSLIVAYYKIFPPFYYQMFNFEFQFKGWEAWRKQYTARFTLNSFSQEFNIESNGAIEILEEGHLSNPILIIFMQVKENEICPCA